MANVKHLRIVLDDLRMREQKHPVSRRNYNGFDLSGANLNGADLGEGDRSSAIANEWTGAKLSGANLRSASLSSANLSGVDLRRADLCRADLCRADLCRADLRFANLRGAELRIADLSRANLCGADLSGADLSGAILSGANFSGVDLSCVTLTAEQKKQALFLEEPPRRSIDASNPTTAPYEPDADSPQQLTLYIDPGDASAETIRDLFLALSLLYESYGGSGLKIHSHEDRMPSEVGVLT